LSEFLALPFCWGKVIDDNRNYSFAEQGVPLCIVGATAVVGTSFYGHQQPGQENVCMLSADNPYVYYVTYVGPACLICAMNLVIFVMVCRVIFQSRRLTGKIGGTLGTPNSTVTVAQVRDIPFH
jgi:hypothetical protein